MIEVEGRRRRKLIDETHVLPHVKHEAVLHEAEGSARNSS
jgi:hypothetical protein